MQIVYHEWNISNHLILGFFSIIYIIVGMHKRNRESKSRVEKIFHFPCSWTWTTHPHPEWKWKHTVVSKCYYMCFCTFTGTQYLCIWLLLGGCDSKYICRSLYSCNQTSMKKLAYYLIRNKWLEKDVCKIVLKFEMSMMYYGMSFYA